MQDTRFTTTTGRIELGRFIAQYELFKKVLHVKGSVVDFGSAASLDGVLKGAWAVISCAPYRCNPLIAERAKANGVHYFDLTEDVAVTHRVKELAKDAKTRSEEHTV